MNPITKYIARFIKRLSVPHCEDCKFTSGPFCGHSEAHIAGMFYDFKDVMRERGMPCGKRGKLFEPKEKP